MATATSTHTLHSEEEAVLSAVKVRRSHRPGRWSLTEICQHVHMNAEHSDLEDVEDEQVAVLLGQLIERCMVYRVYRSDGMLLYSTTSASH